MNSCQKDVISVTFGSHLGIAMLPFSSLIIVIPAVTTTNTTASPTDNADVYLNESAREKWQMNSMHQYHNNKRPDKHAMLNNFNHKSKLRVIYPSVYKYNETNI